MAYELTFSLALGAGKAGLTDLRAQLLDDAGADVGSAVSSGFVDVGSGNYTWNYASMPDGHRGSVKFYSAAASSDILAVAAVNPQEVENTDAKTSTRSSHDADDVWTSTTRTLTSLGASAIADFWATLTNTLTTDGSIGKLIVSKMALITGPFATASSTTRDFTIIRAVTFTHTTATLAVPGSWDECYVTGKCDLDDLDGAALFQIKITDGGDAGDGLQILNGAAAETASEGSLTVNADTVDIVLADDATALLSKQSGAHYDVKFLIGDGTTLREKYGTFDVEYTATRTI